MQLDLNSLEANELTELFIAWPNTKSYMCCINHRNERDRCVNFELTKTPIPHPHGWAIGCQLYLGEYSENYTETGEVLLKTHKFCHLPGTVFKKSCLFSLLWKTTCLERPQNSTVALYRFHYINHGTALYYSDNSTHYPLVQNMQCKKCTIFSQRLMITDHKSIRTIQNNWIWWISD